MHKDAHYDRPIKVRGLSLWPLNSDIIQFLLLTATAYLIKELKKVKPTNVFSSSSANFPKHPLFRHEKRKADMSVIRGYLLCEGAV